MRDFSWLIVMEERTPTFVVEDVIRAAGATDLRIVRVRSKETWHESLAASLRTMLAPGSLLVSTRLDSDDLLAMDYLAAVRERAQPETNVIMLNGVRFNPTDGRLVEVAKPVFENLCSVAGRHVHEFEHSKVQHHYPSLVLRDRFAWAQLIHGGNLANRAMQGRPIRAAGDLTDGLLQPRRPSTRDHLRYLAVEGAGWQRKNLARARRVLGLGSG
jgi:hypothetical protein